MFFYVCCSFCNLSVCLFALIILVFKNGSCYIGLDDLELIMQPRTASSLYVSSCLSLLSAGITGVSHHSQLLFILFLETKHFYWVNLFYLTEEGASEMAAIWKSESNLLESDFSFHHVGSRDQTQVDRFGIKCLYLLKHLAPSPFYSGNVTQLVE